MSFILNPYRYASTGFPWYAQADGAGTDIYDATGIQSGGTFTVPSSWNGRYVRHVGNLARGFAGGTIYALKGGSKYSGGGGSTMENVGGTERGFFFGAPVSVSTSDTFTASGLSGTTDYHEVAVQPSGFNGALVYHNTTQSITTSPTSLAFNSETYDLDSWHDTATNNDRLTVPSGVSLVRCSGQVYCSGFSVQMQLTIYMNGSNVVGVSPICDRVGEYVNVTTPPIACSPGDYFTLVATASSGTGTAAANGDTWFAAEELNASLKYAVGVVTTNQAVSGGSTFGGPIYMGSQYADVGTWFTPGDEFFTVPSGITKIRMGFSAWSGNTSTTNYGSMGINGDTSGDIPQISCGYSGVNTGVEQQHGISGICTVTPGDLIYPTHAAAVAGNIQPDSFYWVEEVLEVTS